MTATGPEEATEEPQRGMRQLASAEFDGLEAIGGWRGMVESVAPGLVFVVVFVAIREVVPAVIASVAVAVLATVLRLIQRTPVTQAVGGLLGIGIGAVWAWRSGEAQNFFVWGLYTNLAFAVGVTISILVRWPVVGVIVATLFGKGHDWRSTPALMRRYTLASWLWVGAFVLRLVVQVPLYLDGDTGWLGAARLVMGLPLWALVLWVTWVLVNPRADPEARQDRQDPPTS
ncbi:DUF3159 domain-containing protein [Pseudactinotalea terrae]|uniref:DUF3159 domain-containing protein n=1 Tax=Pseudactinotalea terrae TaxID=1743262 RepID=UPI0012E241CA|nr:DUF3159 domain-containing protein [Pseudactinotalea terrae]